jgi:Asp-tRNA(Asn)/Glu-tRNA(Gln) amidotransferase A subunit family amidase
VADDSAQLIYLSAGVLARRIREKKVSAQEAVKACLARIAKVNPQLNAVVQLCAERALAEAREADALLAKGQPKGPLHGVPMTIKDSFDTAGVVSTGGTLGRKEHIPAQDATVVARLRAAGAILLGKTNTPEFTLSFVTSNLIYGATRNPYNLDYQPSGSSGGAAAIVAAGGAPFEIGSDFAGSIRVPSHACGIAGIKPTHGLVPRSGHIIDYGGAADAMQQIGPLARSVEDLALLLPIIAGPDDLDATIAPVPVGDYRKVDLRALRIAWYTSNGELDPTPEIAKIVSDNAARMAAAGAKVAEARPPQLKEIVDLTRRILGGDGGARVQRLVRRAGTKQTSPQLSVAGSLISAAEFATTQERLDDTRSRMLAFLEDYDAILCPPSARPAPKLGDPPGPQGWNYTFPYNILGWPAAVVRAGTSPEGLPLGIQIVGRPWTEHVVLAVAAHLESKTGGWQRQAL